MITSLLVSASVFKVYLPHSKDPEYSQSIKGQALPQCAGNEWKVDGETFDTVTSCLTNSTVKLRVNPFRCTKYAEQPSKDGVFDCLSCNYGFSSSSTSREIYLYETPNVNATEWIVSKGYSPVSPRITTCIMTADPKLWQLCDSVQDVVEQGQSTKSYCICPSDKRAIAFEDMPLTEKNATSCSSFAISKNNLTITCEKAEK